MKRLALAALLFALPVALPAQTKSLPLDSADGISLFFWWVSLIEERL